MDKKEGKADLIIHARWVIPVVPRGFFEYHSLVVKDSKIVDLLSTETCKRKYEATKELNLSEDHVLIPGLINTHCHTPMSLLRGFSEDCVLMDWLMHYMWPAEGRWVNEEFVELGSSLTIIEMLKNGITCFNDMYFFPEVTADVVNTSGMRALIGIPVIMFPSTYAKNQDDYLEKGKPLFKKYENHPRIKIGVAPHSPYTVDNDGLKKSKELAKQHNAKIHIHIHETETEIVNHINDVNHEGSRPIERLNRLGLIDNNLIAVHMTQLIDEEITLASQKGVNVSSCPSSNMKLASGICDLNKLIRAKINVSLGTDGPASNDDVSILHEMRVAILLDRHSRPNILLHGTEILEMATLNGAKTLGFENQIGSLEIGKEADVVAIKLETLPVYNPINTLTYVATNKIEFVWVAGKCLVEKGQVLTLNTMEIQKKAKEWGKKIHEWDIERRKIPLESLNLIIQASQKILSNKSAATQKEVEEALSKLQEYSESLFHWTFFAGLPEYPPNNPKQQEIQYLMNIVTEQIQSLKLLSKNFSS